MKLSSPENMFTRVRLLCCGVIRAVTMPIVWSAGSSRLTSQIGKQPAKKLPISRRRIVTACGKMFCAFLGGAIRQTGAVPDAVGGVGDHVHLLVGLRATHCLADVVQDIKTASSKWVHREIRQHIFSWQEGYGAFTVSPSHRVRVKSYIANQEEHHRQKTYQEEYLELLEKAGVDFDPKFLW